MKQNKQKTWVKLKTKTTQNFYSLPQFSYAWWLSTLTSVFSFFLGYQCFKGGFTFQISIYKHAQVWATSLAPGTQLYSCNKLTNIINTHGEDWVHGKEVQQDKLSVKIFPTKQSCLSVELYRIGFVRLFPQVYIMNSLFFPSSPSVLVLLLLSCSFFFVDT